MNAANPQIAAGAEKKKGRQKRLRKIGKSILRRAEQYLEARSLVPNDPVLDSALFPWVAELEANWREIRGELDQVLQQRERIPRFQDVSSEQERISPDDKWRTYVLRGFGYSSEANCRQCPKTAALLDRIPRLQTAFFSILAPGKHVPRHRGITKIFVRCHLGLVVPKEREKCVMEVGGVPCVWQEGRAIVFDDTYPHEVHNDTDEERVVLLFDFDRPMRPMGRALHKFFVWAIKRTAYFKDAKRNLDAGEQAVQRADTMFDEPSDKSGQKDAA